MDESKLIKRKIDSLPHLMPKDRTAVAEYIESIRGQFSDRILAVALFGSKARGNADDESDIDLLVLVDVMDNDFRSELWDIASDISLEYNVVVSPCVFGQDEWDETRRIHMPLYCEIEKYNVPLTPELVPS